MAVAAILNFKTFNFWSCDCNRVQHLLQCTEFHRNWIIFHWHMAIWRFSKWRLSAIFDFKKLHFLSRSPYQHAVLLAHTKFRWNRIIGWWVMARKAIFKMAAAAILSFKNFNFCHVVVIECNIWCSVPSFNKIGQFFTEIWRFNHFQNGGRPPSWILKICSFCHVM